VVVQWLTTLLQQAQVVVAVEHPPLEQTHLVQSEMLEQAVRAQQIQLAVHLSLTQVVVVAVVKTLAQQVVQAAVAQVGQARQD
jgi:hypothetical protein